MATVQLERFDFLDNLGFAPGQTRSWEHGPFNPFGRALVVTAQPFDASSQDRTLVVTEIRHRSTDFNQRFIGYTIRNTGVDTVIIYYVFLGWISP
jgi:hypothetical protein